MPGPVPMDDKSRGDDSSDTSLGVSTKHQTRPRSLGKRLRTLVSRMAFGGLCLVLLAVSAGVIYEHYSRWMAPRAFPPPGDLVAVNGALLHLNCMGEGEPTVILEAGGGSSSAVWLAVQPQVSRVTRVCSYDRAGLGWSQPGTGTRDAETIADDLHALLAAASVDPPYVMVGHSLGGPLIMVFGHEFDGEVVGLVYVDSTDREIVDRLQVAPTEEDLKKQRTMQGIMSLLARTGVLRASGRNRTPPADWPSELVQIVRAFEPQSVSGAFLEMSTLQETLAQASGTGPFGDLPTVVLTAGRYENSPDRTPEQNRDRRELRLQLQSELAGLSTNSDHRLVDDAGHLIQVESPEAVVDAVLDVVQAARSGAPLTGGAGA